MTVSYLHVQTHCRRLMWDVWRGCDERRGYLEPVRGGLWRRVDVAQELDGRAQKSGPRRRGKGESRLETLCRSRDSAPQARGLTTCVVLTAKPGTALEIPPSRLSRKRQRRLNIYTTKFIEIISHFKRSGFHKIAGNSRSDFHSTFHSFADSSNTLFTGLPTTPVGASLDSCRCIII